VRRPNTFWLTGFFNPQGFLTAMKQEVTRIHKKDQRGYGGATAVEAWALDDVRLVSEVSEKEFSKIVLVKNEGVYLEGLFLEGAKWNKNSLDEPDQKQMFSPLPLLYMTAEKERKGVNIEN